MTAPATPEDAAQRWSLLFENGEPYGRRHTYGEWASIAAAVRAADTMMRLTADTDNPIGRGDTQWFRAAIDVYDTTRATGAHQNPSLGQRPAFVANAHVIRAWLDAPWTVSTGGELTTNLHANGLEHLFSP
jgi:hypothetical protein